MFRHVLRNAMAPVLVPITFGIASAILTESALSFLGFGAPPPEPELGDPAQRGAQQPADVVADRVPRRRRSS